jgi:hypothetical protein
LIPSIHFPHLAYIFFARSHVLGYISHFPGLFLSLFLLFSPSRAFLLLMREWWQEKSFAEYSVFVLLNSAQKNRYCDTALRLFVAANGVEELILLTSEEENNAQK